MIGTWTVYQVKIYPVRNKTWSLPSGALHSGWHIGGVGRVIPDTTVTSEKRAMKDMLRVMKLGNLDHIRRSPRI